MDAVTEVLIGRSHEADRLSQMVVVSLAAHAMLIAAVTLSNRFLPQQTAVDTSHVMTISLAGGDTVIQGRNPISAKTVQEVVPESVKPKNDAPPALAKPEMVEPVQTKKPEPKPVAKPEPKKELTPIHGRTPTQGTTAVQGSARVETGQTSAIPFGGLATGGGPGSGARTDFADFCCPEYLAAMQRLIYANWRPNQGQPGSNVGKFVVHRDGSITDISVEQSTNPFLELASRRAIEQTQRLPPLPAPYRGDRLTVYIDFTYK
jgi:protein TonB